jgi:alkanesulfonate monooxygenase SsuD/methylene tetrahydromethanopterin reductase-like flavin-dependent oxidoreductase (luciferase family)
VPVEQLVDGMIVGTPEQCAAVLEEHRRLGVSDFLLLARPPADERTIERFAAAVAPAMRASAGAAAEPSPGADRA